MEIGTRQVLILFKDQTTNIEPVRTSTRYFSVYPTPSSNVLHVRLADEDMQNLSAEIIDLNGKIVLTVSLEKPIDISGLKAGIYFLTVKTPEGRISREFIKL